MHDAQKLTDDSDDECMELMCRVSPNVLIDALKRLNAAQKKSVEEMGFGKLFHLEVDEIPGTMAYWCLHKFQPISCGIQLPNNTELHITPEDVFLIFGFPKGPITIERPKQIKDKDFTNEWELRIGKKKYKILHTDVVNAMCSEVDGGIWFKRHFLILVENCLFENATDGYVKPRIMDIIGDLSKIRDYNWCDHMITCLHTTHERWLSNRTKNFIGPALFIVVIMQCHTLKKCTKFIHLLL